ncbi:MAG: 3'-5' exonuclease [Myxococcota bacterium]|nr:3'-5' exonuclease [Myxococcota bacterium]
MSAESPRKASGPKAAKPTAAQTTGIPHPMPPEICFAFLDCEFGGLDVELHDLTEVGIILTDYRLVEFAEAQWRVRARPERISAEAAEIFGYDEKLWSEAPPVRQVLSEISAMLPADKIVVPAGQNVRMDVIFLERAYKNCELPYPFDYHVIDLATLFYSWSLVFGERIRSLSLRQAATEAGLLHGETVRHRALADARLTLETFRHYIGRLAPRDLAEVVPRGEEKLSQPD